MKFSPASVGTGKFFGFQHYDIEPDIVVVAKPIGGGLPLGAILGNTAVADVLEPGVHGTTFGGNPVACAAGIVVMHEIVDGGLMENAKRLGTIFFEKLNLLKNEFPGIIKEVRGFGLMVGMELAREGDSIVKTIREKGILVNCTSQTVLRFLPPLIINESHVEETIAALRDTFKNLPE